MGQVLVSAVEGNGQYLDGGSMFGSVPRALWQKWHPCDELGRIKLATRALLISCDDLLLLCEAGIGNFFPAKLAERFGVSEMHHNRLLTSLNGLGVDPDDIDYVILSHLHFDHVGGLLNDTGGLNFSRARYVVSEDALMRAQSPHIRDRASFIDGLPQKLKDSGRLSIVTGEHVPEIPTARLRFIFSNGHTPGQMHTIVSGQQQTLFFAGDLIPGTSWTHLPITMGFDRFPEQIVDEKQRVYRQLVKESWLVFYTHDPKTIASQIEYQQNKYQASGELSELRNYQL